jgi:hypothetical protein
MDWFESLTGFRETGYEDTRAKLRVEGSRLQSLINRKSFGIGELELVSLQTLRERAGNEAGFYAITEHLHALDPQQLDALRGRLCIGIHRDVEVTEAVGERRPLVSQVFCSALPVAYTSVAPSHWKAFASLVLEGSV